MRKTRILMLGALAAVAAPATAMAQFFGTFDPTPVPEPGTLTILATGVGVIAVARVLRNRRDRDD